MFPHQPSIIEFIRHRYSCPPSFSALEIACSLCGKKSRTRFHADSNEMFAEKEMEFVHRLHKQGWEIVLKVKSDGPRFHPESPKWRAVCHMCASQYNDHFIVPIQDIDIL
jgi:hypothetical protein